MDTRVITGDDCLFPGRHGIIEIQDDGTGMDASDIQRGWLTVSDSPKREIKRTRQSTPLRGRTPLGDKGLGRLGVQRLGDTVEIRTAKSVVISRPAVSQSETPQRKVQNPSYRVGIDWTSFANHQRLRDVPVIAQSEDVINPTAGTLIMIGGLRDSSVWRGDALTELQRRLSQFIFPFKALRQFSVYVTIEGRDLDLLEISDQVLEAASGRYTFSYSKGHLEVKGQVKPEVVRPREYKTDEREMFSRLIVSDRGRSFTEYLATTKPAQQYHLTYSDDGPWFQTLLISKEAELLGGIDTKDGRYVDPGSFSGEIDSFLLLAEDLDRLPSDLALSDYRRVIREQYGVRIFRDGFAIRPYGMDGNDWLNLSAGQTSGRSFYGLRPRNVIGYVEISASQNAQLEEKTDREGFTDTDASRTFTLLMLEVVKLINGFLDLIRRGYNRFKADYHKKQISSGTTSGETDLTAIVRKAASEAVQLSESAQKLTLSVSEIEKSTEELIEIGGEDSDNSLLIDELQDVLSDAKSLLGEIQRLVGRASQLSHVAALLDAERSQLQEQASNYLELAALGMVAETFAHETRNIADSLGSRTNQLRQQLRIAGPINPAVAGFLAYVRSVLTSLERQLSHLTPALRYVREQRETFSMCSFIQDLQQFHQERFQRSQISIELTQPCITFEVRMSRGRLIQVIDNLLLNSLYWLQQDLAAHRIADARICLQVSSPTIRVWDTGRGVAPSVENTLLDPFVTNKPKGQGRGLGLYIARQLLESAGGDVTLLPDRNQFGHRFIFQVDLSGAFHGRG